MTARASASLSGCNHERPAYKQAQHWKQRWSSPHMESRLRAPIPVMTVWLHGREFDSWLYDSEALLQESEEERVPPE